MKYYNNDKDSRCVELYDWVAQGRAYWAVWNDGEGIKQRIIEIVELYDNFNMIEGN